MSSDNGIYIGKFSDGTIRVCYGMAIENCKCHQENPESFSQEYENANIVSYYGDSPVFSNEKDAFEYAKKLEDGIEECPYMGFPKGYTEYGICTETYVVPFPSLSKEEAERILKEWWEGNGFDDINNEEGDFYPGEYNDEEV